MVSDAPRKQAHASTSQIGRTLDTSATLAKLNQLLQSLSTGAEIELVIQETQPEIGGVSETSAKVQAALSAPLTLITDDGQGGMLGPWTISTEQLSALLKVNSFDNGDGMQQYDVSIDLEPFRAYLEGLAPADRDDLVARSLRHLLGRGRLP